MIFTPICVQCHHEMRCKKNDYLFADYDNAAIWAGDMYECPTCQKQVVVGVAQKPLAEKHNAEYEAFTTYLAQSHFTLRREIKPHEWRGTINGA